MCRYLWSLIFCLSFTYSKSEIKSPQFVHYTNEDGLSSSYVKSIAQDKNGFIWLATRASVTRFDGQSFKEFPAYDLEGRRLQIFGDKLYLAMDSLLITRTIDHNYFFFDRYQECFRPYSLLNKIGTVLSVVPSSGGFWICRPNSVGFLDASSGLEMPIDTKFSSVSFAKNIGFNNLIESPDNIVILTNNGEIVVIDKIVDAVKNFSVPSEFRTQQASLFLVDSQGNAWLGNAEHGLIRFDLASGDYQIYSERQRMPFYLPHNLVHCITEDQRGNIWIGSEDGLAIFDIETGYLSLHGFDLHNPTGLNSNPIYDAFCDVEGNVWLGTYFGGVNFWSNKDPFFRTWSPGLGDGQLRGNVVSCLTEDSEGNLWIGLEDNGLNKYDFRSGEVIHYSKENGPAALSYNNIHDLLFVSDHELWIATYTGGINVLNPKTNEIRFHTPQNTPGLTSNAVYSFFPIGDSIFISTSQGIVVHDKKTGLFTPLMPEVLGLFQFESIAGSSEKLWFTSSSGVYCYIPAADSLFSFDLVPEMENINFVKADSQGNMWFGDCYKGLCRYNEKNGSLRYFNSETGFPVSWIFSLEEGEGGMFWASSDKGLVKFSPEEEIHILYDSNSGIPFNQFNYRASYVDNHGNIYFGGNNGMVSFSEDQPYHETENMKVVFTGMKLFNEYIVPGETRRFRRSLNESEKIVLDYNQNVLTFEYAALAYSAFGRCQYAYYLKGFEEKWNYVGTRNFATYTNLSPGTYYFHVKASMGDIRNTTNERILKIVVRPPIWLSKGAFVSYFVITIVLSIMVLKVGKNIERSKALLTLERREREHADEINQVKLEFFTNISHELKTPLTLIIGPLSRLMKDEQMSPAFRRSLSGIERNAHRLFNLINQLLEFRKIETGKDQLKISKQNVPLFIKDVTVSFSEMADSRGIEFIVHTPEDFPGTWFDAEKVDKVLINLLSNAFKFTGDGGKIELVVDFKPKQGLRDQEDWDMTFRISDTGKGMAPDMLDKIFERFFQVDDGMGNSVNSGIGLAYVRSLVLFHRGTIDVKSEINQGSVFTVVLPVSIGHYSADEIVNEKYQYVRLEQQVQDVVNKSINTFSVFPIDRSSDKPSILLVEDNLELVHFLVGILEDNYRVEAAFNGREALSKLDKSNPDLIISDIMMPEMDGIALTQRLKSDLNTSHIPVILLTSKSGVKDELEGLMTGADYYIGKPFFPDLLVQLVENVLNTRQRIIDHFREDASFSSRDTCFSDSDKDFLDKLTKLVKGNLNNQDLDVTFLISEIGVSRSLLHKKLKGVVGCSATEFIRIIRLKEAGKLIGSGKCNIAEAAYESGFSSPAYFTRCFKEFFGQSPRDYYRG